jgi:hypothetical protein
MKIKNIEDVEDPIGVYNNNNDEYDETHEEEEALDTLMEELHHYASMEEWDEISEGARNKYKELEASGAFSWEFQLFLLKNPNMLDDIY